MQYKINMLLYKEMQYMKHYPINDLKELVTLTGVQGYSGQVAATATAPSVLVHCDNPTKNSLPVNNTSDPDNKAFGLVGSITV